LAAALAAGVEVSAHAADATTVRAPADNETTPVGGATAMPGESGAKPQPTVDPTALAVTQQNTSDADAAPLVPPIRLERLDTAFATQNVTLPHVAMPAVTDNHAPSAPAVASGISTPVGAEGWDQALGQRVVWMVAQRNPTAEIHVNPPNLGPLSVTVNVDNNTANATFVAAHAATRDAINEALPRLKEMLADSGIALGQVTVNAESFSHGGGSGAQQAYVPREHGVSGAAAPSAAGPLVSPVKTSSAPIGLVDTFA
jgi:flagellar hook-length control protein FliK